MAEAVGFEPTEPCGSSHFKCGALNQTLPRFRIMHTPSLSDLLQFAIQPAECALSWLRVMDSNHRPLAYEANSLTSDVTRDKMLKLAVQHALF